MSALPALALPGRPAFSTAALPESTFQLGIFEGLFVHGLQARGAFATELCEAGYDARRPERDYPSRVLKACLEVACRHAHPGLPQTQAMRRLGERFWQGFLRTQLGRLVQATPLGSGPEGLLKRLPRTFNLASSALRIAVHQEGERDWRVEVWERHALPDFAAGVIARVLVLNGVAAQVDVAERSAERFALQVRW
ncbi:MAG: DUF2378 family protein [Myxococcaceae bacterium]|nr:DUF2378 family protein [Myxococcaceae bacterium]MCI0670207.1 DUF2378 family protein [Myxococcaceae bacterium]